MSRRLRATGCATSSAQSTATPLPAENSRTPIEPGFTRYVAVADLVLEML